MKNEGRRSRRIRQRKTRKTILMAVLAAAAVFLILGGRILLSRQKPGPTGEEAAGETLAEPTEEASAAVEEPVEEAQPEEEEANAGSEAGEEADAKREQEVLGDLREELDEYLDGKEGTWSYYVIRTDTGSRIFNDAAFEKQADAGLIKLTVAGRYLQAVEKGDIEDRQEDRENLRLMLSQDDSKACDLLIDLLGLESVNTFIQELELDNTELNGKISEEETRNYISAENCAVILEMICKGEYVSGEASRIIYDALREQSHSQMIPAGLPEGTVCADKAGELPEAVSDAAIIEAPSGQYILCVMSEQGADSAETIEEISRRVYEAIGGENAFAAGVEKPGPGSEAGGGSVPETKKEEPAAVTEPLQDTEQEAGQESGN